MRKVERFEEGEREREKMRANVRGEKVKERHILRVLEERKNKYSKEVDREMYFKDT